MLAGSTIGHFQLVSRLGRGGMGEVWLAEQREVGTRVAIKLLLPDISEDEVHVQRFFNEARAVGRIQHAGIVRIFDVGQAGERAYLIMELLEGESLAQRIRRGPLSIAQIGDIGRQIASVLEATHSAGVTHRDLKPDNVFLVPDRELPCGQRVKVLDFGIAKLTGTLAGASPRTMGTLGTPAYMAPEQWGDASKVDWRADLYSLGCLAFELACGRPPFVASNLAEACAQHLHDAPPRARTLAPAIPKALDDLIAALLAKDPARRPARMRDVTAAFASTAHVTHVLDATLPSVRVEPNSATVSTVSPPAQPRRRSRIPAVVAAITGTLVAAGLAAGMSLGGAGSEPEAPTVVVASDPAPTSASTLTATAIFETAPAAPSASTRTQRPRTRTQTAPRAAAPVAVEEPAPQPRRGDSGIEVVLPSPDPRANLPLAPTLDEMTAVLEPLEDAVMQCATADSPSSIGIELIIMPSGKLARATPLASQAHTDLGLCASKALIRARFPETQHGATPRFTFKLR